MLRTAASLATVVVVSIATASAECAWVLWTKTATNKGSSSWEIVQASSNREDCLAALDRAYKAIKGATTINQIEHGAFSVTTTDRTTTSSGKCLPDTVDPRGPKGSGR